MIDRQGDEQRHESGLLHCAKGRDAFLRMRRPVEWTNMADFLPVVKGLVEERLRSSLLAYGQAGDGRGTGT